MNIDVARTYKREITQIEKANGQKKKLEKEKEKAGDEDGQIKIREQ